MDIRQRILGGIIILLVGTSMISCGSTGTISTSGTPTATLSTPTATHSILTSTPVSSSATPTPSIKIVKVFFSKNPDSMSDFTAVFPVTRSTTSSAVGTFALEQLLAGPTASESSTGLFSQTKKILPSGASSVGSLSGCGVGISFTLSITGGVARMQFCVATSSGGIGDDARTKTEITKTLSQFSSTVSSVKVCTSTSEIFGDESGMHTVC
jgi:hypothetical protein